MVIADEDEQTPWLPGAHKRTHDGDVIMRDDEEEGEEDMMDI